MAMTGRRQEFAHHIGRRIKELRKGRGWSQERLARELAMSRQTVFDAEHGLRIPEWETLGVFEIELSALLPAAQAPPPPDPQPGESFEAEGRYLIPAA